MGMIYKGLTFDGVNSLDYGIYITGEGVYNAPTRDVEMITIAGRNGEYALDKGRFNNISITYNAGTFGQDQTDFAEKISDFRNAILSKVGYKRLEDDYHTDEYRMAVYMDGLEVDPVHYSEAGEFELTFNCKPQRFLKSGEEPQTIGEWGETETDTGSIASFEAESNTSIKSLIVDIEPFQSGSGNPSPTNIRPISGWDSVVVEQSGKNMLPQQTDGMQSLFIKGGTNIFVSADTPTNGASCVFNYYRKDGSRIDYWTLNQALSGGRIGKSVSITEDVYFVAVTNATASNKQIEFGSTATAYEPYQGETITKSLGRTVYGGTLDLVSGELVVNRAYLSLNTANMDNNDDYPAWKTSGVRNIIGSGINSGLRDALSNIAPSVSVVPYPISANTIGSNDLLILSKSYFNKTQTEWKALALDVQFVIPLATPQTYQLTAEQISTILGINNIIADSGDTSVEFGADPNILVNPTPFESQPLLEADGYGAIYIEGQKVNIAQAQPIGNVTLWKGTEPPTDLSVDIPLDTSKFNTGDKIYLSAIYSFEHYASEGFLQNTTGSGTSSNADFIVNNATLTFSNGNVMRFDALATDDIEFVVGTAKEVTTTFTITTVNPSRTIALDFYIEYDPTRNMIYVGIDGDDTLVGVDGEVYGYSSVVIQANTFIDCEIGEAYYIEDGEVISANNSVTLPAILPKLKTGNNDITYDNTITSLKITPRWWKI